MSDGTRNFACRLLLAAGIAAFSGRLPRGVGLTITVISALNTVLAVYAGTGTGTSAGQGHGRRRR